MHERNELSGIHTGVSLDCPTVGNDVELDRRSTAALVHHIHLDMGNPFVEAVEIIQQIVREAELHSQFSSHLGEFAREKSWKFSVIGHLVHITLIGDGYRLVLRHIL